MVTDIDQRIVFISAKAPLEISMAFSFERISIEWECSALYSSRRKMPLSL
jgi:hypothetical protein